MKIRLFGVAVFLALSITAGAQTARFETNLGNIDVELDPTDAPKTVANFLQYVNSGAYKNSFIHRSVPQFVFQGGGYTWSDVNGPVAIPANPPVVNEFKVSNTRGTIAMAKLGNDPNSATNQWFFNEGDNSSNLDGQDGGFTVFGRINDSASLAVMDAIAGEPVYDASTAFGADFSNLPLVNYDGVNFSSGNLVNGLAPTSLDGVTVTVNGTPAYVNFVSPNQVNAQIPAGVPNGASITVKVAYKGQTSAPATITIQATAGALLAPASFKVNGTQYAAAFHADGTFVTAGNIPGVAGSPAKPGETIVFYGVGFGSVTSGAPVAGHIASGQTKLSSAAQFLFGTGKTAGSVQYQGLAPNYVGLYQFNVTVPVSAPNGDLALQVSQGGTNLPQTLFVSVHN